jgi:hypothetical protein
MNQSDYVIDAVIIWQHKKDMTRLVIDVIYNVAHHFNIGT